MPDTSATILIGYDGSDEAATAIRRAGELLEPRRAVVAYVWESLATLLLHSDVERLTGSIKEAADELDGGDAREAELVAARGAELAEEAGFEAVPIVARSRPRALPTVLELARQPHAWPVLLEHAQQHDAAVVVVGARGVGRAKSALLGSVSAGVLDHAHLPVLIVPPTEEEHEPGPVLIGYDGSDQARAAVEAAGPLLKVRETVLQTVWTSYQAVAGAGVAGAPASVVTRAAEEIDRGARERAQKTAEEGARLAKAQGLEVKAETLQASGNVSHALLDSVHAHRAAAVVVGSRGRSAFGATLMGSVSRALVHHLPAPVLVVRPPA